MLAEYGESISPQHCTEALRREVNAGFGKTESMARQIIAAENKEDYPQVAQHCRIITAETHTALVCQELIDRFQTKDPKQSPIVVRLSVVPLKIGKNNCKPG